MDQWVDETIELKCSNLLTTHPVHEADICQHEEVDLDKKASLCCRIGWHAPNSDSKSMQEAHVDDKV